MKKIKFQISGINCQSCVKKIVGHFEEMDDVTKVEVIKDDQVVIFEGTDSFSGMKAKKEFETIGFPVVKMEKL